jgi:hypothetical protein
MHLETFHLEWVEFIWLEPAGQAYSQSLQPMHLLWSITLAPVVLYG